MKIPFSGGLHIYSLKKGEVHTSTPRADGHVKDTGDAPPAPSGPSTGGAELKEKSKRAGELMRLQFFGHGGVAVVKNFSAEQAAKNPEKLALLSQVAQWQSEAPKGEKKARANLANQLNRAILSPVALPVSASCKGLSSLPDALFSSKVSSVRLTDMQGITALPEAGEHCKLSSLALDGASGLTQKMVLSDFPQLTSASIKGASNMPFPDAAGAGKLESLKLGGFTASTPLVLPQGGKLKELHLNDNPGLPLSTALPTGGGLKEFSAVNTPIGDHNVAALLQQKGGRVDLSTNQVSAQALDHIAVQTSRPDYQGPAVFLGNSDTKPKNKVVADIASKVAGRGLLGRPGRLLGRAMPNNIGEQMVSAKTLTPSMVHGVMPLLHAGSALTEPAHAAAHHFWAGVSGEKGAGHLEKFLKDASSALGSGFGPMKRLSGHHKQRLAGLLQQIQANPGSVPEMIGIALKNTKPDNHKDPAAITDTLNAMEQALKGGVSPSPMPGPRPMSGITSFGDDLR
jgi:hypothetical protein